GESFGEPMPQRIHALSEPAHYPDAPGTARTVTAADTDLFAEWFLAFVAEAIPEDAAPARDHIERKAASGDAVFWQIDGEPVAMAAFGRRIRSVASISLVYTPPELRRRGYAGSATAAVVERAYAEGRKTACLNTDLRNPASNRCYARIGFRPVCESWLFPQERNEGG
ncbi:MAG: GNAT family N-acetyltransferase, partial [Rhodomicrobium sp.]|nr:GNAT family N-acetyltransferase [Rhodomicrobium sp.]